MNKAFNLLAFTSRFPLTEDEVRVKHFGDNLADLLIREHGFTPAGALCIVCEFLNNQFPNLRDVLAVS